MDKKNRWDDIPSLEGIGVDWEYKPVTTLGKRRFVRLDSEEIHVLFEMKDIFVKVSTVKETYTCHLLDINKGGLSLILPVLLEVNQPIKVGFLLGRMKILSKALVKHITKIEEQYATGIEFVDLNSEAAEYINQLYASLVMRYKSL